MSRAVQCWALRTLRAGAGRSLMAARSSGGATSQHALRRAGVQAVALAEVRVERDALEASLRERDKALALAQRQLTQEAERRRAVEVGKQHAAGELERLRHAAGQWQVR